MQTPIEVMMGMAEKEIENYINLIMRKNSIPVGMMMHILKNIQLRIAEEYLATFNNQFVDLQIKLQKYESKEEKDGDSTQKGSME